MYENSTKDVDMPKRYVRKTFFIMRLITLLLTVSIMQVSASGFAQRITILAKKEPLEKLFREIHKQTGYDFLYDTDIIASKKPVDISVVNRSIDEVLEICLEGRQLQYKIDDKTILVSEKPSLPKKINREALLGSPKQEKITVTGEVRDSTGVKIPGVSVVALGKSKTATQTDANGKYVLDVDPGTVLRFSFVGFKEQTVTVNADRQVYNVILKEDNVLKDVVVTAYNRKQSREGIVGSVTTVKPMDMKIPASNLTNALAGQVAGVIAFQPSGQPGQDNANFFIRGVTTFGYKQDPLILIDNVELSANDLARLNVDDIESFSVLKDASATALYGARGGNGVILVKTKEGKNGAPIINVRLENSISESAKTIELADPITYMRLFNEAVSTRYPFNPLPYSENKIINTEETIKGLPSSNPYVYPATDWMDMLFKKRTNTQRANLSINGGGGVARYYVAGSYSNDDGIIKTDIKNNNNNNVKFQNYQLRSNVNINVTKKTELVVRLSGTFNDYNGPLTGGGGIQTELYNLAMHTSPVDFPAYYPADEANLRTQHILFGNEPADNSKDGGTKFLNPYAELLKGHQNFSESRMLAQLELNQNLDFITEGLNIHGIFSTNRYAYFRSYMSYSPFYYTYSDYDKPTNSYKLNWINSYPTGGNVAREYLAYTPLDTRNSTFFYVQGVIDYSRNFGKDHNVNGALISTAQQTRISNAGDLFNSLPYRNQTLAGRLTYSFKSRYFLEGNFGYNGSERFSEKHRYGFFPTIGASWVVSGEKFWGGLYDIFNRFKLRGSYGLVGNDGISDRRFFYLSDVDLNGGNYASFGTNNEYSRNGVKIKNYQNDEVTWETSKQANLGLEFTFMKKLDVIAEVYRNHKTNILLGRNPISTMGLESNISANIGEATSRGIDLQVVGKQSFGDQLFISLRGNLTYSHNEFTRYEERAYKEPYRTRIGQPLNRSWGYIAERLFVDDNEAANSPTQIFSSSGTRPKGGDIKYRDLNNDGKIDGADQAWIGNPTIPEMVYGFGLSATFKNFDLSAFFQGQAKVSFFIDAARIAPFIKSPDGYYSGNTQLLKAFAEDHWSEDDQRLYALYPRFGPDGGIIENNRQSSTWWMRDGSFLRLKQAEIGYTLPKSIAQRLHTKNVRAYVNGLNLITWSPFRMWDPELGGNGFAYPIQKVFNLGLNVNF